MYLRTYPYSAPPTSALKVFLLLLLSLFIAAHTHYPVRNNTICLEITGHPVVIMIFIFLRSCWHSKDEVSCPEVWKSCIAYVVAVVIVSGSCILIWMILYSPANLVWCEWLVVSSGDVLCRSKSSTDLPSYIAFPVFDKLATCSYCTAYMAKWQISSYQECFSFICCRHSHICNQLSRSLHFPVGISKLSCMSCQISCNEPMVSSLL